MLGHSLGQEQPSRREGFRVRKQTRFPTSTVFVLFLLIKEWPHTSNIFPVHLTSRIVCERNERNANQDIQHSN